MAIADLSTMNESSHKSVSCISMLAVMLTVARCAPLPNDGANAQVKYYEKMHGLRYIEIFVVGGNGINVYARTGPRYSNYKP